MKRFLLGVSSLVLAMPASANEAPVKTSPLTVHSTDFHPNPKFIPAPRARLDGAEGSVEQLGEIAILEGDAKLVTTAMDGSLGIEFTQDAQNAPEITKRLYTKFDDSFDEVIIFTSFTDTGAAGALAYEMSTQQDVKGIGQMLFDDSGPDGWGAANHKLHAFVNMMRWDQYKEIDGLPITDPRSSLYSTLGQEFAHRWLAFLHYIDRKGHNSNGLLGRDQAHWASTLQADGSVVDGNTLVDNHDGSFTVADTFQRYGYLDLYGMGIIPARDVPPFFRVPGAVDSHGNPVNPNNPIRVGQRIFGTREDIAMSQVIAADGPRSPDWAVSPHEFRVAWVLVTRPGEKAGDVVSIAQTLDTARRVWEDTFHRYTGGRATMCTQLSAPCGSATAKVDGGRFVEAGGNNNGVIEPGEPIRVTFSVGNDGPVAATGVSVKASSEQVSIAAGSASIDRIAPGGSADVSFLATMPKDAACGTPLLVRAESAASGNVFRGFATVVPGIADAYHTRFDHGGGLYAVNLDGGDTALGNGWEFGAPLEYRGQYGYVFQPGAGHAGGRNVWFTGLSRGHRGQEDSSLLAGANGAPGTSTLWSPPIRLDEVFHPVLRYYLWFQAIDYSSPQRGGQVDDTVPFVVEASVDGRKTWTEIDRVTGAVPSWQLRERPLDGVVKSGSATLHLRFTAQNPYSYDIVEAGLDDISVVTQTPACNPDALVAKKMDPNAATGTLGGGGCAVGQGTGRSNAQRGVGAALLFALAGVVSVASLVSGVRRRRRQS